jgi:hypothetical protein
VLVNELCTTTATIEAKIADKLVVSSLVYVKRDLGVKGLILGSSA